MKKLSFIAALLTFGLIARADTLDDDVKKFADALKSSSPATAGATAPEMNQRMAMMSDQLESTLQAPGGDTNLDALVRQMMATNSSPDVQRAGQALLDDLAARKKARLDDLKSQIQAIVVQAPDILLKAQKPQELDGLLADLTKVHQAPDGMSPGGYDPAAQGLMTQLNEVYQFVSQWQDYLSARNNNNYQAAQDALRNLSSSQRNGDGILVPRSEILTRIDQVAAALKTASPAPNNPMHQMQPPTVDETAILNGIKTLDDMEPALAAFKPVQNTQNSANSTLTQFASIYAACKNGLPFPLDLYSQYNNYQTAPPAIERIHAMLLLYLLPRYLGPNASAPNPNESVADYLNRETDEAANHQDWVVLRRIVEARMKIVKSQSLASGANSFLAGLNQDVAGQYALAVASYQNALRSSDDYVPAKVAGDRLAAIKKEHPAEYDQGLKDFNTTSIDPYIRAVNAMNAARSGAPGSPGGGSIYPPAGFNPRTGAPLATGLPPDPTPAPVALVPPTPATNIPPVTPTPPPAPVTK